MSRATPEPGAKRSIPPGRSLLFWAIALTGAGFDLATKTYFFRKLGEPNQRGPLIVIPNLLELQTSHNTGALWGFARTFPHSSLIFAVLSILAAVGICYWLFALGAAADRRLTVALALIMAGALGNCYDRLVLGHVRDFVHLFIQSIRFDCAIFNFADNMLVVGAIALVLLALRPDGEETVEPTAAEPATSA